MGENENKEKDNPRLKWLYEHLVKSIVSWVAIAALAGVGYSIIIIKNVPSIDAKVKKHDIAISKIASINEKLEEFDNEFKIIKVCLYKMMKATGIELSDEQLKDFLSVLQIPERIYELAEKGSIKVHQKGGWEGNYFKTSSEVAKTRIPKTPSGKKHVVVSGDTLRNLAKQYYNDSAMWHKIYEANEEIIVSKSTLANGQVIVIPEMVSSLPEKDDRIPDF
jgi:nucleoid-associated protein YgaU